jgi:ubiquinone/menaquinone biosynthesis C-methylase UbiE
MDRAFETGAPIAEEEALAQIAALGLHGLAFDQDLREDEPATDGVSAPAIYDRIAVAYEAHASNGFANAHLDRPAVLSLCGDVAGLDVLDVGCGPGLYAAELLDRGARSLTAFDASVEMVRLATGRLGPRATVTRHDADRPLTWLHDASIDLVVCALMIHYVEDRPALYRELHRVLRSDGALVLSTQHPTADWLRRGGSYFSTERTADLWRLAGGFEMPLWRLSLSTLCSELTDSGFLIERLVEPLPAASGRAIDPDEYARCCEEPSFLALRAIHDPRQPTSRVDRPISCNVRPMSHK